MRLLLAEDRPELVETYSQIIKKFNRDYYGKIELICANSMEDLSLKMLTERIDGAIIDNNLQRWTNSVHNSLSNAGFQVCKSIVDFCNFKDFKSQVILYSASSMGFKNTDFMTIDKLVGESALDDFERKILGPISSSIDVKEIPYDKFCQYSIAEKTWYYKKYVLQKINAEHRFREFAPSVLWSSDLINENKETLLGGGDRNTISNLPNTKSANYLELDEQVTNTHRVPTILWNFMEFNYFSLQDSQIYSRRFQNGFIKLFYRVAYANSLVEHILTNTEVIDKLPEILHDNDLVLLREIQCGLIEKLHKYDEVQSTGRKYLSKIQEKFGLEIVDYFKCSIESVDEETDSARVQLISFLDSAKYFYRNFSYERLRKSGIKYRDSEFIYYVSDYNNSMNSYFEPR